MSSLGYCGIFQDDGVFANEESFNEICTLFAIFRAFTFKVG